MWATRLIRDSAASPLSQPAVTSLGARQVDKKRVTSWSAGAAVTASLTGQLKQQTFISHGSGGWTSEIGAPAGPGSWGRRASWLVHGGPPSCILVMGAERGSKLSPLLSYGHQSTMEAQFTLVT